MKTKHISVFSDTNIDYNRLLPLYKVQPFDGLNPKTNLVIVDIEDFENSKIQLDLVRDVQSTTPILWVIDPINAVDAMHVLENMLTLGRIEVQYRNRDDFQGILQSVAILLNPDLPTKRVSMDLFIPVFNEAHRMHHIGAFVKKLQALNEMGYPYITIYFIDDGSSDDSDAFLNQMINRYLEESDVVEFKAAFRLLPLKQNTRKAGTYMEAFRVSTSDIIIFADADDAFRLNDISRMINIINQGFYDMVIGTKDKTAEDRPFIRDVISTIKRWMTKPLLPKGVTDSQTGLKMFRGAVVKPVLTQLNEKYGLAIDLKIIHVAKKMNLRVLEVPVYFKDRDGSHIDVAKDSIVFIKNMVKISLGM